MQAFTPSEYKSVAAKAAVLSFFVTAGIGLYKGLPSYVCCKRGVICAIVIFALTVVLFKVINAIVLSAFHNDVFKGPVDNEQKDGN